MSSKFPEEMPNSTASEIEAVKAATHEVDILSKQAALAEAKKKHIEEVKERIALKEMRLRQKFVGGILWVHSLQNII